MECLENRLAHFAKISEDDMSEISSYCEMGSMGMLNSAARCLKVIRGRLVRGERLTFKDKPLDLDSFDKYIRENFSPYIIKEVLMHKYSTVPTYFSLMNTDEGFDLIYTRQEPNDLFTPIANISEEYALVFLNVNCVVYIKNHKSGDLVPMISEHNNHYVYDKENGKIKEVMKDVN